MDGYTGANWENGTDRNTISGYSSKTDGCLVSWKTQKN